MNALCILPLVEVIKRFGNVSVSLCSGIQDPRALKDTQTPTTK